MKKNFFDQFKAKKYKKLPIVLIILGMSLLVLATYGNELIFPGNEQLQTVYLQVTFIIFWVLMCGVGLLAMIREEFQQVVMIRGRAAQMMGLIMFLIGMNLIIYIIWYMTQR